MKKHRNHGNQEKEFVQPYRQCTAGFLKSELEYLLMTSVCALQATLHLFEFVDHHVMEHYKGIGVLIKTTTTGGVDSCQCPSLLRDRFNE